MLRYQKLKLNKSRILFLDTLWGSKIVVF